MIKLFQKVLEATGPFGIISVMSLLVAILALLILLKQ